MTPERHRELSASMFTYLGHSDGYFGYPQKYANVHPEEDNTDIEQDMADYMKAYKEGKLLRLLEQAK